MKARRICVLLLLVALMLAGCSSGQSATVQGQEKPQLSTREPVEVVELSTPIQTQEARVQDISVQVKGMLVKLSAMQMTGEDELKAYLSGFFEEQQAEPLWGEEFLEESTGNIAAVIRGESNREKQAVVITAYYESYEGDGKDEYDGSGLAAVMHTLSYIQSYLGDSKPVFDIVFALVNAEDRLRSETALVDFLDEEYQMIYQIHYEHVAEVGAGPLMIDTVTELHRELPQAVMAKLKADGIACSDIQKDAYLRLNAFTVKGIPSVTIEQVSHFASNIISESPVELLDDGNIDRIAKSVAQFVRDDGYGMFQQLKRERAVKWDVNDKDWQKDAAKEMEIKSVGRPLAYNERIPFVYDGILCYATGYRSFVSQADLNLLYPEVEVPEELGNYRLSKIEVIHPDQMAEKLFFELRDVDWMEEEDRLGRSEKIELNWDDVVGLQLEYYDATKDEYLMLEGYKNPENPVPEEVLIRRSAHSSYFLNEHRELGLYEGILVQMGGWVYRMEAYPKYIGVREGKTIWSKKRLGVEHDSGMGFLKSQETLDQIAEEIQLEEAIEALSIQMPRNQPGLYSMDQENLACVRMGPLKRSGEERECAHLQPYGRDIKDESFMVRIFDNGNMIAGKAISWECNGYK